MSDLIDNEDYSVYCKFDMQKHKKKYINYLEVLILEDGTIEYAVPSHQMKAEKLCCEKLGITREKLFKLTRDHWGDYLEELLTISGAISVWDDMCIVGRNGITDSQYKSLGRLKLNGLYKGVIPQVSKIEGEFHV